LHAALPISGLRRARRWSRSPPGRRTGEGSRGSVYGSLRDSPIGIQLRLLAGWGRGGGHQGPNGPHVGSRMSPVSELIRCLTRPSTDAAMSMSRPFARVAYMTHRPLGAKLGDSSRPPSDRRVSVPLARSLIMTKKPPSRRVTYASLRPSGDTRGLTL